MQLKWLTLVCLSSWPSARALYNQSTGFPEQDLDNGVALQQIADNALNNMEQESLTTNGCRLEDAQIRREWRSLSPNARKEFTDAITCMQSHPTNISAEEKETFQGVKTRYDEFVATHINLTEHIHVTADFLAWHRFFIHAFENALRVECNYTGTLPYWEWGLDAENPQDSVLFNGDLYSMGTNGPGLGGVMQADQRFTDPTAPFSYGVHGGGHLTVGSVLADIDTSPAEPMFWLHHAQIDRVWTIWQGLDPAKRRNSIWGTSTRGDDPPSANMTLDDSLDFGFISQPLRFADLMNPLSGPFCYYYA
ncbi:hypothetical protein CBS147371_6119 [Aspergillus niger]|nr:hypothetical protein CBS147371_6119 [Aspergillus niger]KAI2987430.1 hypothetical protein CBS147344_4820 [Aspergillus niger]